MTPRLLPIFVGLPTVGALLVVPLAASTQDIVPDASLTAIVYKRPIENVFAPGEGLYPGLIVRSPNRQWLMTLQLDLQSRRLCGRPTAPVADGDIGAAQELSTVSSRCTHTTAPRCGRPERMRLVPGSFSKTQGGWWS